MQDGSWNQPLPPISVLLKDSAEGVAAAAAALEGDAALLTEPDTGDCADLTAFLSAEEIDRSLDLAWEAFEETAENHHLDPQQTPLNNSEAVQEIKTSSTDDTTPPLHQADGSSPEKVGRLKPVPPVYKQDKPRLLHEGLELNDRASSASEFCSRAATFIEELSSIFKGSSHLEHGGEEESSSPDSGYLSPGNQRPGAQGASAVPATACQTEQTQQAGPPEGAPVAPERQPAGGAPAASGPLSPPCFVQKLKSQEVAEGSPIRLECRVSGNPLPLIRWFCEGRELHNSPDINIWQDGELHTLVIAEAFEDDTGRYTCVASNSLGADNTSAEVYIEGASSSDSDGEGSPSKSRSASMPVLQKKTTSMCLTIRSASPKTPEVLPHRSTLVQSMSQPPQRTQSPVSSLYGGDVSGPPMFTKLLQDTQASEGQVVVLECRVRGGPPVQVRWYRQGDQILDSPDFRILQKKPRSAAESDEICTLVIAEAFPEDGGLFCCTASNSYGSVNSSAQLTVTAGASNVFVFAIVEVGEWELTTRSGCRWRYFPVVAICLH
ncbi:palladin-like [Hippocampus comes]|uniref:palladin-like n=1 Tax=Hippocampus comes TaxID=109280 RepID=UPI00094EC099|nr:PREDICTED: palladin-like [Hippocampus comes]